MNDNPCKTFKYIWFWNKKIEKQTKIATHMDFWKYGQILTIQKFLIIKRLRFSNKRFSIWVYHLVLHHILSPNKKFGMWINIIFSFCDVLIIWLIHIFRLQKFIITNKWVFLSTNNHIIFFIMKFLV
jgi:hypothetical protein